MAKIVYSYNKAETIKPLKSNWAVAELKLTYRFKKRTNIIVSSAWSAAKVFRAMWDNSLINIQEQFCVIFLNTMGEVIGFKLYNTGTIKSGIVDVNLVLSSALLCRATNIIIAHNHPSGDLKFSDQDLKLTQKIREACEIIDVTLKDHIILTNDSYSSFFEIYEK